jgi:hypothetical protein
MGQSEATRLAVESLELAAEAMRQVAECYRLIAEIPEKVEAAARPHIELSELNAELSRSWANDATRYAAESKRAVEKAAQSHYLKISCN